MVLSSLVIWFAGLLQKRLMRADSLCVIVITSMSQLFFRVLCPPLLRRAAGSLAGSTVVWPQGRGGRGIIWE